MSQSQSQPAAANFRLGRVLLIVGPIVAIAILVILGIAFLNVESMFARLFQPPLVEVKGTVYWNGEPLKGDIVRTRHENRALKGASGYIDQDGNFTLETVTDDDFKTGAYPGKHKVVVELRDRSITGMPAQPPLLSPEKYANFSTTDLEIVVDKDPAKNQFKLEITGDGRAPARPAAESQPSEPAETVEAAAKRIMEERDADKDGKLTGDEQRGIPEIPAFGLTYGDTNMDGALDEEELRAAIQQARGGGSNP